MRKKELKNLKLKKHNIANLTDKEHIHGGAVLNSQFNIICPSSGRTVCPTRPNPNTSGGPACVRTFTTRGGGKDKTKDCFDDTIQTARTI